MLCMVKACVPACLRPCCLTPLPHAPVVAQPTHRAHLPSAAPTPAYITLPWLGWLPFVTECHRVFRASPASQNRRHTELLDTFPGCPDARPSWLP